MAKASEPTSQENINGATMVREKQVWESGAGANAIRIPVASGVRAPVALSPCRLFLFGALASSRASPDKLRLKLGFVHKNSCSLTGRLGQTPGRRRQQRARLHFVASKPVTKDRS